MADWSFFDIPAKAVSENLLGMAGRADDAIAMANSAISQLETATTFAPEPTAPHIDLPDIPNFKAVTPKPPAITIPDFAPGGTPSYEDLWNTLGISLSGLDITIPDFNPVTGSINMPPRPDPLDTSGAPVRPAVDTSITVPTAPDVVLPAMAALADITIPDFTFPDLPTFDAVAPEFTEARPSTTLIWAEPVYTSVVETDLVARVRAMLAGGTGLPANVQQALFDAARSREAGTALEATQAAFDTWAAKGFSMPPGMLSAAVQKVLEKSQQEQNTLQRDILTKSAVWEIENLRAAVERGMAYETMLRNYFNNVAERSYQAAKYRIEADIALYNAAVGIFNARTSLYRVAAEVLKIRVDAALAKLEVFKAQIQAAVAKGQLNEQLVKVFLAQVEGVKQVIEVFKAKMEGAKVQSEVVKNIIATYGEDVKAYGEKLNAGKTRFEAYYEEVRAESEKAHALEYEARAYEATVRGQEAKANAKARGIEARTNVVRASVEKFRASIEEEQLLSRESLEAIQAKAGAFSADVGRYKAEIDGVNESRRTDLLIAEARLRNNLSYFETQMKEYDSRLGRLIEQVKVQVTALDAAARASVGLASGAMSAIHVQASMSGSGSASDTNNYNVSHNFTDA